MIVYAESSAVLAWLLGEPEGERARQSLSEAERVVASTLTAVECGRSLTRALVTGRIGEADELAAAQLLDRAAATWVTLDPVGRVLARARARFPSEPTRTMDAIHLATALQFHAAAPSLVVLSFDDRVRTNASALGLSLAP